MTPSHSEILLGRVIDADPIAAEDADGWPEPRSQQRAVGSSVFVAYALEQTQPEDIDTQLYEPLHFEKDPGDTIYPAANGHSRYPLDPRYQAALDTILGMSSVP